MNRSELTAEQLMRKCISHKELDLPKRKSFKDTKDNLYKRLPYEVGSNHRIVYVHMKK